MSLDPPAAWEPPLRLIAGVVAPDPALPGELAGRLSAAEWQRFAELVIDRHRVAPVVAPHLAALPVPPEVRRRIEEEAERNTRLTLVAMAGLRRILAGFAALGVTPVVLKGWPLGEDLYGSAAGRQSNDLDLLVPAGALEACAAALLRLGYAPIEEHRLRSRLVHSPAVTTECNDIEFEDPGTGLGVELHWRPHKSRTWPDLVDRDGADLRQRAEVGAFRVPSDRANVVYLSVHGSLHRWSRLKWLADLARLARRRGPEALAEDLVLARRAGAWKSVALGLRLSARVLGSPLPPGLAVPPRTLGRLEADMLAGIGADQPDPRALSVRLGFYTAGLRLADGPAQWLGVLRYGAWRPLRLKAAELARSRGGASQAP